MNKTIDELIKEIDEHYKKNEELYNEIDGLTHGFLERDLEEAVKYNRGYFKNDDGEYMFLKGIEVDNNTGNLCKMGYNGEDRGVWARYVIISDNKVLDLNHPISMFTSNFSRMFVAEKKVFRETTKEEFDAQVEKTIRSMCAPFDQKREPKEYLDALKEGDAIMAQDGADDAFFCWVLEDIHKREEETNAVQG